MDLLLTLLIVQAVMGAFDTIYHHELTVALPAQASARSELYIHALRSIIYGVIFAGLAWFVFGGGWITALWALVAVEVVLTLIDFLIEDRTRVLPQSERVLHTLLAIGGGAAFMVLALQTPAWWRLPSELVPADYGWKSWFLTLAAVGVTLSGVRDALAARTLSRVKPVAPLDVGGPHLRFLIAGGTGFIGTALTRRLIAGGHDVTLVARNPARAALQFGGAARCIHATAALSAAEPFDVVINLAGAPVVGTPWTRARKRVLLESRLAPTEDLLRYAARAITRPRVWIQASAIGYYGQSATNIDEQSTATAGDFASELCHRWEARAETCAALGIRYVALRFGLVMGRSGGSFPPLLLGLKLGAGSVIGGGRQFVSWIH
ncbi:MAG: NAD-dependent epimerase/dehydratase family protein, partial [Burkholderiales bacterium]